MSRTASDPLAVACVGAGYFAGFHIDSWQRMHRACLVGVCDRDKPRAEATGARAFDDVAEMLDTLAPEVLDVIVPPAHQADVLEEAFDRGVPTVICQKPFCRTPDEAREMTRRALQSGTTLIVHENFRFQPWFRAIRGAIRRGDVGELLNMSMRLRPGDGQGPHAYLDRQPYFQTMERFLIRETGIHFIDTFRFIAGDPTAVYADLRRLNPAIAGEDAGYVLFDHPDRVKGLFDGNRLIDHRAENHRYTMGEALFEGTEGVLELFGDGTVWHRRKGALERRRVFAPDTRVGFAGDCVHALNAHVVAALLDGNEIENLAADYLKVIEIEEAIYRSASEGRKVEIRSAGQS